MTFIVWLVFFMTLSSLGFKYGSMEFTAILLSVLAILLEGSIRRDKQAKKEKTSAP